MWHRFLNLKQSILKPEKQNTRKSLSDIEHVDIQRHPFKVCHTEGVIIYFSVGTFNGAIPSRKCSKGNCLMEEHYLCLESDLPSKK